jgi:hypothetical protein
VLHGVLELVVGAHQAVERLNRELLDKGIMADQEKLAMDPKSHLEVGEGREQ